MSFMKMVRGKSTSLNTVYGFYPQLSDFLTKFVKFGMVDRT